MVLFVVVVVFVDESPGTEFVGFGDPFCGILRDDAVALQFMYGFGLRVEGLTCFFVVEGINTLSYLLSFKLSKLVYFRLLLYCLCDVVVLVY